MPELLEVGAGFSTTNVTVTTTTETIVATSELLLVPTSQARAIVTAWAHLTTGTGTTAVTPRVRRGDAITSTIVGDAVAEEVKAAAGSDEHFDIFVVDTLDEADQVQYVFTLQQTGASADGTILQGGLLVLLI